MMKFTKEQVEQIPELYQDFMLALRPVLDYQGPDSVMQITSVHLGKVFSALRGSHDLDAAQLAALAANLQKAGMIERDSFGFISPTERGRELIRAIIDFDENRSPKIPEFPSLAS